MKVMPIMTQRHHHDMPISNKSKCITANEDLKGGLQALYKNSKKCQSKSE